jgi:hypothetical protein
MLFLRRQLLRTLSFAFGSSFTLGRNQLAIAAQTAVQPKTFPLPAGAAVRDAIAGGTEMEKVTGIGGFKMAAQLQAAGIEVKMDNAIKVRGDGDPLKDWILSVTRNGKIIRKQSLRVTQKSPKDEAGYHIVRIAQ